MERVRNDERRKALFRSLDEHSHFNQLFDHLPGVHFFAKDVDGRILFANRGLLNLYGYESEAQFIGRTDFDILPVRLAEKFRLDDLRVMETDRPLLGIVELFLNPQGIPDWYITDKLPLRSSKGEVLGVMGTIRVHRESKGQQKAVLDVDTAVAHLRDTFMENEPMSSLAERCGLSTRQFEIKFKAVYNTSPSQFRIRLRVMRACELLRETHLSVADVAIGSGFYDQSALAHHFKTIMGYTPLQYRKRYS
ncbi:helix-turn-helix domain-containing protein [Microbacterium sp. A93]|uniref:helix-turn-helix domain-containing protein n=1 Tax=Microbacterium sp. A93 TaxID=3450716 RepID=UPI003F43228A